MPRLTDSRPASSAPAHRRRPRLESPRVPHTGGGRRITVWALAAVVAGATAGAVLISRRQTASARPAPAAIRTVAVRSGPLERTVRLVGSTAAARTVELRAPYMRGRRGRGDFRMLINSLARPGAPVSKGQLVAGFDPLYMQIYLDNERAHREQAETGIKQALVISDLLLTTHRQKMRAARAVMEKAELDLKSTPVRSAIESSKLQLKYEEAAATYRELVKETPLVDVSAKADVARARLELKETQVEEQRAQDNLDRMSVRAPIGGVAIISEIFHAGERKQIRAGDQIHRGQPYMRIVDPDSIVIEAKANQADIESLRLGAPARVYFDAYPGLVVSGRLNSIAPLAKKAGHRQEYVAEVPVQLRLDGQDARVIPSLTVAADVILAREESDGIVPREAVFYGPEDRQPYAFLKTADGWEKRDLELGLANHVAVSVRSGLKDGDIVAAEMPAGLF